MARCHWCNEANPLYVRYHDEEWGVPLHDDRVLFELLILEGFQAGLSWECVLNKREAFRIAFDGFDMELISKYNEEKLLALQNEAGIIRNRLKIAASVKNARVFCKFSGNTAPLMRISGDLPGERCCTNTIRCAPHRLFRMKYQRI